MHKYTRITSNKLKGIHILLTFVVEKYVQAVRNNEDKLIINSWFTAKERLAEIQKKQFYDEGDKVFLNNIRETYYKAKEKYGVV